MVGHHRRAGHGQILPGQPAWRGLCRTPASGEPSEWRSWRSIPPARSRAGRCWATGCACATWRTTRASSSARWPRAARWAGWPAPPAAVTQVLDAAGFDLILIETVGAGQSEVDIARLAHTTMVVEAPGLGDDIQAIKAGILEIADILVVNKADLPGRGQHRAGAAQPCWKWARNRADDGATATVQRMDADGDDRRSNR